MNKVLLRISVPKLNSRTTIAVEWTRTLWEVKKMLISDHKLTNLPREVVNYGFYYHALTENNTDGSAAASSGDGFTNGGAVDCGASVNNATTTGTQNDALHVFEQGRTLILLTDSYQLSDYTTCLKPDDATGIVRDYTLLISITYYYY